MRAITLSNQLSRELGVDYVVTSSPDHPELIAGPDVLVGGRGQLTALFKVARNTQVRMLHARVAAARLALPAQAVLVALVDRDSNPPRPLVDNGFDVVVDDDSLASLVSVCGGRDVARHNTAELQGVQHRHGVFYSTVMQIAQLRQRHKPKATSAELVVNLLQSQPDAVGEERGELRLPPNVETMDQGWSERRVSGSARAVALRATVRGTVVVGMPGTVRRPVIRRLRSLWAEAFFDDVVFDAGIPYHRRMVPRVLLVESWPMHRSDPEKPSRGMAFSGWLLAIATSAEEISALASRSVEVIAKRLHA